MVPWGAAEGAAGARQEAWKVRAPTAEAALVAAARVVAVVAAVVAVVAEAAAARAVVRKVAAPGVAHGAEVVAIEALRAGRVAE